jgi:hypothetical protein
LVQLRTNHSNMSTASATQQKPEAKNHPLGSTSHYHKHVAGPD